MENASYISLSSQMALERQMDVVANNLANATTSAFKGERVVFAEYLSRIPGATPLSFVQDAGTARDTRQGTLSKTGNPLDLALEGEGYLQVDTPSGPRFTRNGHLQLDAQGELVTSQGYKLLAQGGRPITLPQGSSDVSVGPDGTISTAQGQVGRIDVVTFERPGELAPAANGLYVTDQTPQPASDVKIMQGMIEESNVQPIVELTRLMAISRAVGAAKNLIDGESERQRNAIDKLGKVAV